MNINQLCLLFGITPTTTSRYIRSLITLLIRKLKKHPVSRVKFPTADEEKERLAAMVHTRKPTVTDVIGFTDGLSFPVQCSSDIIEQSK